MKKRLLVSLALTFILSSTACFASIIPPKGPGQIGLSSVILCNSLTVRDSASSSAGAVATVHYGDRIIVMDEKNGWSHITLGDSEDSTQGWVNTDYILVDPSYYETDDDTTVYAWNSTSAKKIALLNEGNILPIIKDDGDWILVSIRGASGWINNPNRSRSSSASPVISQSSSSSEQKDQSSSDTSGEDWFTVYAKDGATVRIHHVGGAMYEDSRGRTYSKDEAKFYCITTDITYALDPTVWTGEYYGENEFPDDDYDDYDDDEEYTNDFEETGDGLHDVYAEDGEKALISWVGGKTYEDTKGRTFISQDGGYYCISQDKMYYA